MKNDRKTIEEHREERGTAAWLFEAARALWQWPTGRVLTGADYDAAIAMAGSVSLSSPTIHTDRGRAHERADRARRTR